METKRTLEMWILDKWINRIEKVPLSERSEVLYSWIKNGDNILGNITSKQFRLENYTNIIT